MFCQKCGKEIIDEAVICPHCGCATGVKTKVEVSKTPYKLSAGMVMLCTFLPVVGLIMGIVELSNNDHSPKGTAIIGQSVAGFVVIGIVIGAVIVACSLA